MRARVPVTFAPAGVTVWVSAGTLVAEAAKAAGVLIPAPCGGRGVCGRCGVRVVAGELEAAEPIEAAALERAPFGVRLACRARVCAPVTIRPVFSAVALDADRPVVTEGTGYHAERFVVGVDLGTTTVAAAILDADSGREIARAAVANRQAAFGTDVVSRISAALDGRAGELQQAAEESVRGALEALAVPREGLARVERLVIAANSAMAALLAGADVSGLAAHPFTAPECTLALVASVVRDLLSESVDIELVPPMAAFVGGDALAATVAAGLVDVARPTLLVDIGTNAELVLAMPDRMLVSSTAAGPAFEGAGISAGGPAAPGAVERVEITADGVVLHTIGDLVPGWFSGAGLVSAIAALRSVGCIDDGGAMVPAGPLSARFGTDSAGVVEVRLSRDDAPRLALTQLDVRALQLAKAAVQAGAATLLRVAGISAGDLDAVLVAGAFGAALDPQDLVELGVLPRNAAARIRRVGNAALEGAAAIALDPALLDLALETARRAVHVDLAADEGFNRSFVSATRLAPYEA